MTDDFLYRGEIIPRQVRFFYTLTTQLCNEAVCLHDCDPVSAHLLGRALTTSILTAPLLSDNVRQSITWRYNGMLRTIIVEMGSQADVRAIITPTDLAGKAADLQEVYGEEGLINVVKSTGTKILSASSTPAGMLDVTEDIAFYLSTSEQIETGMTAMIGFTDNPEHPVNLSQGFLIQALPDCDFERYEKLRARLLHDDVRQLLATSPRTDTHVEQIIRQLLETPTDAAPDYTIEEVTRPVYRCTCDRERSLNALATLEQQELKEAIAKKEPLVVNCHFCRTRYEFGPDELSTLIDKS